MRSGVVGGLSRASVADAVLAPSLVGASSSVFDRASTVLWDAVRHPAYEFPLTLFQRGEPGVWYDPSDLSTLFQDTSALIPVSDVGQPVGRILDKSRGTVPGPNLINNGDFDGGTTQFWTSQSAGSLSVVDGALRVLNTGANTGGAAQMIDVVVGKTYLVRWRNLGGSVAGRILIGTTLGGLQYTITINAAGEYQRFVRATAATMSIRVGPASFAAGDDHFFDDISIRELDGAHAFQAADARRPVLQRDETGAYYLQFDGVDDCLFTEAVDFTSTDKVTVCAGLRKLSDASRGLLYELSTTEETNSGSFVCNAPFSFSPLVGFSVRSRGSEATDATQSANATAAIYAAPTTRVLVCLHDISASRTTLRVDRLNIETAIGGQGTGNFGTYPLFIGARNNSQLRFNGRLYQLVVRGAMTDTPQLEQLRGFVNQKTRAYT